MKLAILGAGGWGTALSIVLEPRFTGVSLWVFEHDLALRMAATRVNDVYLPGLPLPAGVEVVTDPGRAVEGADIVLGVMPSRHARRVWESTSPCMHPRMIFVSATKGLENGTMLRMSEVLTEAVGARFKPRVAALSGPTFAREVARGEPTAVVVASSDLETAGQVQSAFSGPTFRLYTNSDITGVEIGGALKNVIAIAAGVVQGLGLGNNTMAALISRGLAEISRLAVAMGGDARTLAGLAGLGDLVLTCTGELSRNRSVGIELAKGRRLADILAATPTIAEGVETVSAAVALGDKFRLDLPVIQQMNAVLHQAKNPRDAIRDLMDRALRSE